MEARGWFTAHCNSYKKKGKATLTIMTHHEKRTRSVIAGRGKVTLTLKVMWSIIIEVSQVCMRQILLIIF